MPILSLKNTFIILPYKKIYETQKRNNTEAKKALDIKAQIDKTDKEIDQMVYKLYDLTEDEIKIVEGI